MENATPDGIEDLLIEDLDCESMNRIIREFHCATGGYNFKEIKKYLMVKAIR
jgi:ERCC4-related helicase